MVENQILKHSFAAMTGFICNNPLEITEYFLFFMTDVTALTFTVFGCPTSNLYWSVSQCFDTLTTCSTLLSIPKSPVQVLYSAPVENELKMPPQLCSLCFIGFVLLDCFQVQVSSGGPKSIITRVFVFLFKKCCIV